MIFSDSYAQKRESDPKRGMTHQNPKKGPQKNKTNKEMGLFLVTPPGSIF